MALLYLFFFSFTCIEQTNKRDLVYVGESDGSSCIGDRRDDRRRECRRWTDGAVGGSS